MLKKLKGYARFSSPSLHFPFRCRALGSVPSRLLLDLVCPIPLARHRPPGIIPHSISPLDPFGLQLDSLSHSFGLSLDLIFRSGSSYNLPRCLFGFVSLSISSPARSIVPASAEAKPSSFWLIA
jgi:hypothetical protein